MCDRIIVAQEEYQESRGIFTVPLDLKIQIKQGDDEQMFPKLVGKPVIEATILDFVNFPYQFLLPIKLTGDDLEAYTLKKVKSYLTYIERADYYVSDFVEYVERKYRQGDSHGYNDYSDTKARKVKDQVARHLWVRENQMNHDAGLEWSWALSDIKENLHERLKEFDAEIYILEHIGFAVGYW